MTSLMIASSIVNGLPVLLLFSIANSSEVNLVVIFQVIGRLNHPLRPCKYC